CEVAAGGFEGLAVANGGWIGFGGVVFEEEPLEVFGEVGGLAAEMQACGFVAYDDPIAAAAAQAAQGFAAVAVGGKRDDAAADEPGGKGDVEPLLAVGGDHADAGSGCDAGVHQAE